MPINTESTPPPLIGKIGPYTVFMTPPSTPSPASPPQPVFESPKKVIQPPPVQPPPQQFDKSVSVAGVGNGNASVAGFFRNAVSKVQNGNSYYLNLMLRYWRSRRRNLEYDFYVFAWMMEFRDFSCVFSPIASCVAIVPFLFCCCHYW